MPEVLKEGLPDSPSRAKFDFTEWADGQAWKFVKGKDYESSTETFRSNVKRWAKSHGYEVECRYFAARDKRGRQLPANKSDPVALGVRFRRVNGSAPEHQAPSPYAT